jgi:hypothetical protein
VASKADRDTQLRTIWEHPGFDQQPAWGQLSTPPEQGNLQGVPGSKVDTVDLLWLGESESKSRKSDKACSEGQEASHADRKRREGLKKVGGEGKRDNAEKSGHRGFKVKPV